MPRSCPSATTRPVRGERCASVAIETAERDRLNAPGEQQPQHLGRAELGRGAEALPPFVPQRVKVERFKRGDFGFEIARSRLRLRDAVAPNAVDHLGRDRCVPSS